MMPWKVAHVGRLLLAVCGTLGLITPPEDAVAKGKPTSAAEAQLSARIERARDQLINELGAKETSPGHAGRIAQWYNWPNWSNWHNGWRNW